MATTKPQASTPAKDNAAEKKPKPAVAEKSQRLNEMVDKTKAFWAGEGVPQEQWKTVISRIYHSLPKRTPKTA